MGRKRIPDLHFVMILVGAGVLVLAMVLHAFKPTDELFSWLAVGAFSFLTGKFTNGFGGGRPKSGDGGGESE